MATVSRVDDRERRVVSGLNTTYLSAEAIADIERLGIQLVEGQPLTVCDYDADEDGNPTWLVAKGVAHFDAARDAWQIAYTMDEVPNPRCGHRGLRQCCGMSPERPLPVTTT
jgi:hypothetical protein